MRGLLSILLVCLLTGCSKQDGERRTTDRTAPEPTGQGAGDTVSRPPDPADGASIPVGVDPGGLSAPAGSGSGTAAPGPSTPAGSGPVLPGSGGTDPGAGPVTTPGNGTPPAAGSSGADCPAGGRFTPGDHKETLQHGGKSRTFQVHVPAKVTGKTPVPLVFDLHPRFGSGAAQRRSSGWLAKSDEEGFIVVHADGVGGSWNSPTCCSPAQGSVDDQGFIRSAVELISGETCIDQDRIYSTGHSNGGALSEMLACESTDLVAGIAPVSFPLPMRNTSQCKPSGPVSAIIFHGSNDSIVNVKGGGLNVSAEGTFKFWAENANCSGRPEKIAGTDCQTHTQCDEGVEVALCIIAGGGHSGLYRAMPLVDTAWAMFERAAAKGRSP